MEFWNHSFDFNFDGEVDADDLLFMQQVTQYENEQEEDDDPKSRDNKR